MDTLWVPVSLMASETPRVESFIIRFIQDAPEDGQPSTGSPWHGVIVHVQSNQEKAFVRVADAFSFMARYVSLPDLVAPQERGE